MRRSLPHAKKFWRALGPGLITGASDDDPSAITTFSQAGAAFGLKTLWVAIPALPMLAYLQEVCARIGMVTGMGLAGVVKKHYPSWVLYLLVALSCPAFLMNIGADIAAMGEAGNLLWPGIPPIYWSMGFTLFLFLSILYLPFEKLTYVMKFFCLALLVYVLVPFLQNLPLKAITRASLVPTFSFDRDFILTLTGLIGSIFSPYLFFWQTTSEVEAMTSGKIHAAAGRYRFLLMRMDILAGAFFAVLIMYFVILTAGSILHDQGIRNIHSIRDAALALKPLAGNFAFGLFSIGIIATGFLIIPVLAGSLSYILTEAFSRKAGLNRKPREAGLFYLIIGLAMCAGIAMHWLELGAVKILLLTTLAYGILAPLLIAVILHIANNNAVMGRFVNSRLANAAGLLILLLMTLVLAISSYFLLTA